MFNGRQFKPAVQTANLLLQIYFFSAKPSKSRLDAYLTQNTAIPWTWQLKLTRAEWPTMEIKPKASQEKKYIEFISICLITTPSLWCMKIMDRHLIIFMSLFIFTALSPLTHITSCLFFFSLSQYLRCEKDFSRASPFKVSIDHLNKGHPVKPS